MVYNLAYTLILQTTTTDRVLYFVGVVYLTPFRINMLILTILSMTSSLRSMEKPNSNDLVRVSSWTYNHWHLTGNPILAEEVFSRQKKSGEKMANLLTPFFAKKLKKEVSRNP